MIALSDPELKLIIIGGKGGVGKTTVAASLALALSKSFKTIVVSTDPAHSLADSFAQEIGDRITKIDATATCYAYELNAERAFKDFIAQHDAELRLIMDTGTYFDEEDIDMLMNLALPGMDEVMGLKAIIDLIEQGDYDKYIIDTAPTGHALRLLMMPELLDNWVKVFAKLRWKYRTVVSTFKGNYTPDAGDDLLLSLKKAVKRIESTLKNSTRCEFLPVTIPAEMAIAETQRLIQSLRQYGIAVRRLILNQVVMEKGTDALLAAKYEEHRAFRQRACELFHDLEVITIGLQPTEVRGKEKLEHFSRFIFPVSVL
ncbi:MAG: ArsA family ATPase [Candidatus Thermochlorobacter sp.]